MGRQGGHRTAQLANGPGTHLDAGRGRATGQSALGGATWDGSASAAHPLLRAGSFYRPLRRAAPVCARAWLRAGAHRTAVSQRTAAVTRWAPPPRQRAHTAAPLHRRAGVSAPGRCRCVPPCKGSRRVAAAARPEHPRQPPSPLQSREHRPLRAAACAHRHGLTDTACGRAVAPAPNRPAAADRAQWR